MPEGSCWCKAVSYSYTGPAAMKIVCHCISCQKISGTAFTTNLFVPKSDFTLAPSSQKPQTYIQPHETGLPITIYFCGKCATTLWKHGGSEKFDEYWVVQAGTLDAQEGGSKTAAIDIEVPEEEYWTDCRAGWVQALDGMKQHGGFA